MPEQQLIFSRVKNYLFPQNTTIQNDTKTMEENNIETEDNAEIEKLFDVITTVYEKHVAFHSSHDKEADGSRKNVNALEAEISPLVFAQMSVLGYILKWKKEENPTITPESYEDLCTTDLARATLQKILPSIEKNGGNVKKIANEYAKRAKAMIDEGYFDLDIVSSINNPKHALYTQKTQAIHSEITSLNSILMIEKSNRHRFLSESDFIVITPEEIEKVKEEISNLQNTSIIVENLSSDKQAFINL